MDKTRKGLSMKDRKDITIVDTYGRVLQCGTGGGVRVVSECGQHILDISEVSDDKVVDIFFLCPSFSPFLAAAMGTLLARRASASHPQTQNKTITKNNQLDNLANRILLFFYA